MSAVKSPWLAAFGIVAVVHLVLIGVDVQPYQSISKCFLAPLLIAWVIEQRGPKLLVAALVGCFFGDLFLEFEDLFTAGMAAFAIAHICFITFFVQRGALDRLKRQPWIIVIGLAAGIGLIAWAWGGLEPGLKPLVPVYALLLLGTASTALATDVRAGIGGIMFLVSDGIIALNEAGRIGDGVGTSLAIMVLYILAIFFLTTAIVFREKRTIAAGPGFDPTVRTDCWPRLPQ
ncbi:lysoplasmalogenase [Aeromicrobium sp. UC242_57]|uniref:lysoplasmalogenase n=1 Tax=Aeromicrobium sp. UC242_57 TaxID=3374624 RepID=UPI0037922659